MSASFAMASTHNNRAVPPVPHPSKPNAWPTLYCYTAEELEKRMGAMEQMNTHNAARIQRLEGIVSYQAQLIHQLYGQIAAIQAGYCANQACQTEEICSTLLSFKSQ